MIMIQPTLLTLNASKLLIPQGYPKSDEEDEFHEEAEDTQKQHSQFTT